MDVEEYLGRAWDAHLEGKDDEAIELYSKAIELDPSDAWAYEDRVDAYYSRGGAYKKLYDIGEEFFDQEEIALAIVTHKKAIEIDPNSVTQ